MELNIKGFVPSQSIVNKKPFIELLTDDLSSFFSLTFAQRKIR
ncbi:BnaC08g49950D [Brassica napus]|uniref:BnaC08g49950D protein n=1 Tax=Brassica napus TaxID=3708 RepID=A0A078IYQ1_BRANA|nr:BnaC08g49950D [Brassica napus]